MAVAVATTAAQPGDVEQPLTRAMSNSQWKAFVECIQAARTQSQRQIAKEELLKHTRPSALIQLDTYALALAVDRRPLSTEEWVKLAISQTVVSETRLMLPYKRSNVLRDVELLPAGEQYIRGAIYAAISRTVTFDNVKETVLAATIGASVCNGFARLAAIRYLQITQSEDTIRICGGDEHNGLRYQIQTKRLSWWIRGQTHRRTIKKIPRMFAL